ncbi:MAG: hypothetical protein ACYC4A_10335 [Desulfobulbia bacterium]
MKAMTDGFGIITVGSWNPRIFTPDWLKKHVCDNQESELRYAIPLNAVDAPPRIEFEGVYLFPSSSKLEVKPSNPSIELISKCAKVSSSIISKLNHTPLTAIGINFAFMQEVDTQSIMSQFNFADIAKIDASELLLSNTVINRGFDRKDGRRFNLSVSFENDVIIFSINYHSDVDSCENAIKMLSDDIASQLFTDTISILKKTYDIELEDQGEK